LKYIYWKSVYKNSPCDPMRIVFIRICLILSGLLFLLAEVSAQPTLPSDLKKPKKYEERKLGSEKSADKKFKKSRKVIQNTVTHYNWYFNANQRLNQVLERAKLSHQDDFTKLLPFYNYSLEATARDSMELDSVIYKTNAGILIHDLRNSWIDNLLMLMGKAYFFRNQLDSAYMTFQYVNYAYSPKDADGYDKPIGSNANEDGNALSISTKEDPSFVKKVFTEPPSRNESFLWQVRTWIANGQIEDAASLLQTLRNDPLFPARLKTDFNELEALYFYNREIPDSAAFYLSNALGNATNRYELSRWEFLIGQLNEQAGKAETAAEYFERSVKHTLDPVMEVYGRLNLIRQKKGDSLVLKKNIEDLIKMGRKDRYYRYRDIIYYTAAEMELERNNIAGARKLLLKATKSADPETISPYRSLAWLLLGDLAFEQKEYREAKSAYDSVTEADPVIKDPAAFTARSASLTEIVSQMDIMHRQDSLQTLAALPPAEREAVVKKKLKELRKQQGLKEEENLPISNGGPVPLNNNKGNAQSDLFVGNENKGEWYFNNPTVKSKGFNAFQVKWGHRPNADNWRRVSAVNATIVVDENDIAAPAPDSSAGGAMVSEELSFDNLLAHIPLTEAKMTASNDSIQDAKVSLGKELFNGLEDYEQVVALLKDFPADYPNAPRLPEVFYYLNYSYRKLGNVGMSEQMMQQLQDKFAGNPYERQVSQAKNGVSPDDPKVDMNRRYDLIYNNFIEGRFEEALQQKQEADNLYGSNYWTPQLLYIESIYHIRQRNDEEAKKELGQITELYPGTPMADKAANLLDVLSRRKEIEEYLTNLKIERPKEDSIVISEDKPVQKAVTKEEVAVIPPADTTANVQEEPPVEDTAVVEKAKDTIAVVEKPKDTIAVTKAPKDTIAVTKAPKVKESAVVVVKPKTEPTAKVPVIKRDSVVGKQNLKVFTYNPDEPYDVIVVLNNVDPVYLTETRNAFNRYNQQNLFNQPITINNIALTDTIKFVVMSGFTNAANALSYSQSTKDAASTSIVPWLPKGKYQFIIISRQNLEALLVSKNLAEYKKFLISTWPGSFE
jgi:tetratricopeptide (TPR) repeat protein